MLQASKANFGSAPGSQNGDEDLQSAIDHDFPDDVAERQIGSVDCVHQSAV